jgi:hypothetical protein
VTAACRDGSVVCKTDGALGTLSMSPGVAVACSGRAAVRNML